MTVSLNSFRQVANSSWFDSRDIVVNGENSTARLGNLIFSSGKKTNDATMAAFRQALEQEYGVFGTNAFDTVLGGRNMLHKSLRASDVKATLSKLESIKEQRYLNELGRQLDTSPKFRELSDDIRKIVREIVSDNPSAGNLSGCATPADISRKAAARIDEAIDSAYDFVKQKKKVRPDYLADTSTHKLQMLAHGDSPAAEPTEPTGLRNLKTVFKQGSTSVEDQVKRGRLGEGMRVNRSSTSPVLLDKLKTNGVEPGFIFRNDWSLKDTHSLMADIDSPESTAALDALLEKCPKLREACEGKSRREQIMLAGRAHPACMAAVAEFMIEEGMKDAGSAIYKAFCDKFPGTAPENWQHIEIGVLKKELFPEIRDAVMSVRPKNADGTPNAIYDKSPVFQHFTDRTIVKLDYNEGDKFSSGDAAHAGTFMRPERILASRKPVLGQIYRFQTRASADDISAGAVTEALANDLTRLAGVPSQELEIVRGQYSDGHPKLMLAAKFAKGYSDLENGMLKDGRAVPPTNPDGSKGPEPEPLGKYKAFFLVTADRDGVGSRGQNKGFVNGKFFAIDPGHSLEGNGKYLKISDDLSFTDTYGKSTKPRFNNFSIFDDDTRFAKLQGVLELRELQNSGKFKQLFDDYRQTFSPSAPNLSDAEKALRTKIIAEIDKKQAEFNESLDRLLRTMGMQLELHDDLAADGPAMQQGAVETLANLEKLFSPTTWVSKKGQVALKHLEVLPDTRVPWRGGVEGDNIVFFCDKPLDPDARSFLKLMMSTAPGAGLVTDQAGVTRLVVPKGSAERFFAACSEEKVMQLTHPEEYQARMEGGDGLREARTYQPVTTPPINNSPGKPLDASSLPDTLDLNLEDGTHIQFQRVHYEDMVTHTPEAERPRSASELRDFLAARIRLGNDIIKALLRGKTSRYEAKLENVTAVTLAFHAAALKKNEFIYRGSFSISDPNGTIARWLDTTPDLYQRTSTHAKPYQSMQVDGHLNMPRGYDVPEGMNGLLNGMRTFHYFTIPDTKRLNDVDKGNGPKRRLFLKCETYGVFVNTIHAKFAAKAGSRTAEMQTRGYQFGDLCESIAHGASLLVSKFTSKTKGGIRKENLPPQIANAMYDATRDVRQAGFPLLADRLLDGGVMEGGGVRRFLDNANKLLAELPSEDALRLFKLLEPKLTQIDAQLNTLNGVVDERMGNEVMLEPDDFL